MSDELFTEDDSNNITTEEVADFLSQQEDSTPGIIPGDIQSLLDEDVDLAETKEPARIEVDPDKAFADNKRDMFDNMYVHVRDIDIPITDDDKLIYMKSLLHSVPINLTINTQNGISGKCRSLSVYEGDVAARAIMLYMSKYPNTPISFQESIAQQYRVAMQLTEYCKMPTPYVSYTRGEGGTIDDHAQDLLEKSQYVLDVPGPVYGIYVRLLNVFQYKLGKLHEAAFNADFWSPAGLD